MLVETVHASSLLFLCVFLSRPFPKVFQKFRCVILKEIEVHDNGNLEDQVAFERGLVEDFVDMVAGTANLAGQPACAALVDFELRLDEVPDVEVAFVGFHCLGLFSASPLCSVLATK